jgi:hypothetical protein
MNKVEMSLKLNSLHQKQKSETNGLKLFENHHAFSVIVKRIWPNELPDNGNWIADMESVLRKLESTKSISNSNRSNNLRSFKQGSLEVMHHFTKILMDRN